MTRRGIPLALVQTVMDHPEKRLVDESRAGRWIHQSRLQFEDGKMYLLRVVVAEDEQPPVIITAYRTSKIEK
jgi:plasmid stabilization system protein ParE